MKGFNKMTAFGVAVAIVAIGSMAIAQDELDDLLKDLEGDSPVSYVECTDVDAADSGVAAVEGAFEEAVAVVEEVTVEEKSEADTEKSGKSKLQTRADSKKKGQKASANQRKKQAPSSEAGKATKQSGKSKNGKSEASNRSARGGKIRR